MLELDFSEVKAAKNTVNFLTRSWYENVGIKVDNLPHQKHIRKKKKKSSTLSETQNQTE